MSDSFRRAEDLFRTEDFAGCAASCRALLTEDPGCRQAAHLLGVAQVRCGRPQEGIALLQRCLAAAPDDLVLRMDCALAIDGAGESERAIALLAAGARFHPGNPDLAARLARLLSAHGRHRDAMAVLRAALAARPAHLELRGLLAAELAADLQINEALGQIRLLQAMFPEQSPFYINEGVLQQSAGKVTLAIRAYRRALHIDPSNPLAHVNLGTALFTGGEYQAGFAHYEHRLALPGARPPPAGLPRWRGEDLSGKRLLLTSEQGYGDLLQFIRFLPLAQRRGARLWLECPVEMRRLLASLPALSGVLSPGDAIPPLDLAAPLLSLPLLLGTGQDLLAGSIPYLKLPPNGPVLPPDSRPKIGLVWSGRPATGELFTRRSLARRSCALRELAVLWRNERFRWYGLQLGPATAELAGTPITDLAPLIGDFADSAALIGQLDVLISIDTAAAHLAAALGRPVWLMLAPGQCDYRWNGTAGPSPWYPAVRLFRAGQGGWPALAAEIAGQLAQLG